MTKGLWRGPVIKKTCSGANAVTQRVQLARVAARLHHVSAATLPAAHGARPRLDPIQQGQSASG
jgi:hypothetical protein